MKKTKILSLLTAVALTLSSTSAVFAEVSTVENLAADFANAEVNSSRTGFSKAPVYVNYSSIGNDNKTAVYGNAKLYKLNNVFGMVEDEYGMEMIAREQRAEQPYISFRPYEEISTDSDFYMQKVLYIGDSRENDLLRVGGEYSDGSSRQMHYLWFGGNGRVYADGQGANRNRFGAVYSPNNWYNVTLAYDAEAKSVSLYIDGTLLNKNFQGTGVVPSTVATGIANMNISARMETIDSDLGGIPSWLVMKDMKVVTGAYVPENTNTNVSSSVYTVAATSFDTINYYNTAQSYVSNVDSNVTVADFLGNITAPEGASKSVVTVDAYSKETIPAADADTVTEDMSLLIRAADGSLKLYDIQVNVSEEDMPVLSIADTADTNKYAVSGNVITVMPHTTVAVLKSILATGEGTTYTVKNASGAELADTDYLKDTTVVAAVKGDVEVEYSVAFKNTTVKSVTDSLAALADETSLFEATVSSDGTVTRNYVYSGPNLLYPIGSTHGNAAGTYFAADAGAYKVTKAVMPASGVAAWKMEAPAAEDGSSYTGWVNHESEQTYGTASNSANGSKIITNFKLYLADANSKALFFPLHYIPSTGKGFEIANDSWRTGYGDKVVFNNGSVYLGGKNNGSDFVHATNYSITYETGKEYDVTLVQNTAAANGGTITSELYIDGVKQGVEHNASTVTVDVDGYRSIKIATAGTVYIGGLTVYMADDYSPAASDETPLANLEILSNNELVEINVADPLYNELPTVKTYLATVGELKSGIDSKVNTRLEILDPTGTVVLNDNETVAGDMLVRVTDINNSANSIIYTISDVINMGEFRWEETDTGITASRLVKAYKDEGKKLVFAVAAYDATGKLIEVKLVEDTVDAIGDYNLTADLSAGAASYKAMLWNGNMLPYSDSEAYVIEE